MFTIETLKNLCLGDREKTSIDSLKKCEQNDTVQRDLLKKWNSLPFLTSEDRKDIIYAFFEHMKFDVVRALLLSPASSGADMSIPENYIKLLLPAESNNANAAIDPAALEFCRQDMLNRVFFMTAKIEEIITQYRSIAADYDEICIDQSEMASPLDNIQSFNQMLNNHLWDGNWQKLNTPGNEKFKWSRQQALLEIEYKQSLCLIGDREYVFYENKYKELAEQIKKDSFTVPSSGKTICSPWRMRNLLKNCVTVSFVEKENNWNWKKYCMIKNVVAGKSSVLQTHNIPQHLYPEKNR